MVQSAKNAAAALRGGGARPAVVEMISPGVRLGKRKEERERGGKKKWSSFGSCGTASHCRQEGAGSEF